MDASSPDLLKLLQELNAIGIALSAEQDHNRLLEMILVRAKEITHADGGTLYSRTEDDHLKFEIMLTESLGIAMGGTSGEPIPYAPLPLYDEEGRPNNQMVAACAALSGKTINIPDAYVNEEFDFSGTRKFDEQTGYRSKSFLTVPMTNHENDIIGVLQLLNARDPKTGDVKTFSRLHQQLVESLASQAAVTITNKSLIDAQRKLFDSLIQLIANAIDEKSPYTAGHCRRVPVLVEMLADAACRMNVGPLKNFDLTDDERYELSVAAWLHDCGKITTPEYVVDKPTKLSTPFDRIDLVETRLEVLKRDAEITALRRKLSEAEGDKTKADLSDDEEYQALLKQLDEDFAFLRRCNIGGESMLDEDRERVTQIGQYRWANSNGDEITFLNDDEIYNLHISRGTLTEEEREIINNHVVVTIKMLESLPYPKHLKRVPEYAGGHHERMDGTGYPNRLTKDDMSIPARMVAIADVFEALTARDRPYKSAMSLSEALVIMGRMKQSHHIDADLFDVFVRERVYARYAEQYLEPREIDDVDLNKIPGYSPSKNEQSA
ncbi:MAG: HD domain-containing phosphohydrolase [Gammaproteobacteria bacterium]